jgi:hypothetical protein
MSSYPSESIPDLRDRIAVALENSGCVWSLIAWYEDVQARREESGNDSLYCRAARDIMSRCFAWVTRPRNSKELEALLDMSCTCSSATQAASATRHDRIRQTFTRKKINSDLNHRPFFHLLGVFLRPLPTLTLTMEELNQRRIRTERRAEWPRSIQDLMPHGVGKTTRALISLLNLEPDPVGRPRIMASIAVLINLYHSLLLPILVTSRTFVIRGIINTIDTDYHATHSKGSTIRAGDLVDILSTQNTLIKVLSALVQHFPDDTERRTYHAHELLELLRAYSRASMLMTEVQENARRPHLALFASSGISMERLATVARNWLKMGGLLLDDCPDAQSILPQLKLGDYFRKAGLRASTAPSHMLPWYRFTQVVAVQESNQQCSAPGCFVNVWTGSLRRCAGCERVVYCSRACQKAAWRGPVPHRAVCNVIAELSQKLDMPKREMIKFRGVVISPSEWPPIEADVDAVNNHFDALTTLRLAHDGKLLYAL